METYEYTDEIVENGDYVENENLPQENQEFQEDQEDQENPQGNEEFVEQEENHLIPEEETKFDFEIELEERERNPSSFAPEKRRPRPSPKKTSSFQPNYPNRRPLPTRNLRGRGRPPVINKPVPHPLNTRRPPKAPPNLKRRNLPKNLPKNLPSKSIRVNKYGSGKIESDPSTHPDDEYQPKVCLTCCETLIFASLGRCNHRELCDMCSLKMRQLFKDIKCCLCKEELKHVIFTRDEFKNFEDFDLDSLIYDRTLKVYFEDPNHRQNILRLWEYTCTKCNAPPFSSLHQLEEHMKRSHNLFYCKICLEHRKVFLHEQNLYSQKDLRLHYSVKGESDILHPICDYCQIRFFNDEELYIHCSQKHETCHLCESENILYQYYENYEHLERHFASAHFLCKDPGCLEKKFIVFKTKIDLQGHDIANHLSGRKLSKAEERGARQIEVNFTVRRSNPTRIDEDLNRSPMQIGPSSIERSESNTSNVPDSLARQRQILANFSGDSDNISVPVDKSAVFKRIKEFLGETKFYRFRNLSRDFGMGKLSTGDYYNSFLKLFGESPKSYSLFEDLLSTLPDPEKKNSLMHAHKLHTKLVDDFPELKPKKPENLKPESEKKEKKTGTSPEIAQKPSQSSVKDFPSLTPTAPVPRPSSLAPAYVHVIPPSQRPTNFTSRREFPSLPVNDANSNNKANGVDNQNNANAVWNKNKKKQKKGQKTLLSFG